MEKCKYHGGAKAASVLMIDDFQNINFMEGESLKYDWGGRLDTPTSIWNYLWTEILQFMPEIKITFFNVLNNHATINKASGYAVNQNQNTEAFKLFLQDLVRNGHELAFHGINHGQYINSGNPEISGNFQQEFISPASLTAYQEAIEKFEKWTGTKLKGGKFPGYQFNDEGQKIIESLNFDWFCLGSRQINTGNSRLKFNPKGNLIEFPTAVSGNIFNYQYSGTKSLLKYPYQIVRNIRNYQCLDKLIKSHSIISIQEHFQCFRTDGKIQKPSIYLDIQSLKQIYNYLKTVDVWYSTCTEISEYSKNYELSKISISENNLSLSNISCGKLGISLKCKDIKSLKHGESIIRGKFKNGMYIFTNLQNGIYAIE
jgi:hypothetical protein